MEQLVQTITNVTSWLQIPGLVAMSLAAVAAGYCFFFMGGQQGSMIGKKIIIGIIIAGVLIFGGDVLARSFESNIAF